MQAIHKIIRTVSGIIQRFVAANVSGRFAVEEGERGKYERCNVNYPGATNY